MAKKLSIIALLLVCAICAHAETILLRTGARVKGSIVFQNEEVVIIRNAEGKRFQYLRSDIEEVLAVDPEGDEEVVAVQEEQIDTPKKVSIVLELFGGAACIPNGAIGGAAGADLLIGSHHIGDKHLFIGGGIGYRGMFFADEKFNFLPLQVALRMPFIEQKHAPFFGIALGYGIALSKEYLGGLYGGIDFGYRYQINEKSALALSVFAQFQQAKIGVVEIVDGQDFVNTTFRNILTPGVKFAIYF
jgi:hypothetical protein